MTTPRLCLLTPDHGPAADSADVRLARLLATRGWDVYLLGCSRYGCLTDPPEGVSVGYLADFPEPPEANLPEWGGDFDRRSLHVLAVVKQLHAADPFDVIQYAEEGGLGFRLAQAHRTGTGPRGAVLVARLRGPTAWRRTEEARWMFGVGEPVLNFAEQTSVELADVRSARSAYLLAEAGKLGWSVPADTPIIPDCPVEEVPPAPSVERIEEVAFCGRLDKMHGVRVFVKAVQSLPTSVGVAFVGADAKVEGRAASRWAAERLKGRRVAFHLTPDRATIPEMHLDEQIGARNRLAVVPFLSAADVELLRLIARRGVPFIAVDYGPAGELIADPDARRHLLAPAAASGSARMLARTLTHYLDLPAAIRRRWTEALAAAHGPRAVHPVVLDFYDRVLERARAARAAVPLVPPVRPKVTVGITHYNLGRFLPETLASVASQTYPNLEVVVADDGSTDPDSVAVVEAMERRYPAFRFLRGPNVGVCMNRNRCLDAATGELFFPLDADNIAAPDMIERLVTALARQPAGVEAVSCFWLGFATSEGLAAGQFVGVYRPSGGPRLAVGLWNPYGETSGLFRTAKLRELGGYDDLHPEYMSEDWHLYIKLAARGLGVAVIPEPLYFYRIRPDSRYRTGDHGVNHVRVLPDVAAIDFSAAERREVWELLASLKHEVEAMGERCLAVMRERDALARRLRWWPYRAIDTVVWVLRPRAVVRKIGWLLDRARLRVWGGPAKSSLVSDGPDGGG
jgi:glycosyltransferase involved in cell wall biosynthesis